MRKIIIKFVILGFIVIFSLQNFAADEAPASFLISGIEYKPMLDGFCAMTSLAMVMEFYGIDTEQSFLLNLGWSYGFFFWLTPQKVWAYPNTGPIEAMQFVGKTIGLKTQLFEHKALKEAKKTLVTFISQGKPVIVQWIGHTVVAIGYEKSGDVIIYHNPDEPFISATDKTDLKKFNFNGDTEKRSLTEWEKPPFLWGVFGYHCLVVTPGVKKPVVDWNSIWTRNAQKTLGIVKNKYPAQYGIEGIKATIEDIKTRKFANEKALHKYLSSFEGTFYLGCGFRREAAAFLAAQAYSMNSPDLLKAAVAFRKSAYLNRAGYKLIQWLQSNGSRVKNVKKMVTEIFEKLICTEKKGAEYLLKAAKKRI